MGRRKRSVVKRAHRADGRLSNTRRRLRCTCNLKQLMATALLGGNHLRRVDLARVDRAAKHLAHAFGLITQHVVELLARPGARFEDVADLVRGTHGRKALETGDVDAGLIWAGQVQGLIHDVPTCAELVARIVGDAEALITERLSRSLVTSTATRRP